MTNRYTVEWQPAMSLPWAVVDTLATMNREVAEFFTREEAMRYAAELNYEWWSIRS